MMGESHEEVRVVEEKPSLVFERPVVAIEGLPDVGLVGTIATTFLVEKKGFEEIAYLESCLLYTSPSPRDGLLSRMPSSA